MNLKVCTVCKETKSLDSYHRCNRSKSGFQYKCKSCATVANKRRYTEKKDKILLVNAAWRASNKEIHKVSQKRWKVENPEKVNYMTSLRRAKRKKATPEWADLDRIKHTYAHCNWLNKIFNLNLHVDHIIPLSGKNVCGLHVHTNLQILPAEENMKKSNSFSEEL